MTDLRKPWPPGLNRDTWPLFVLGFVVAVLLISQVDILLSRWAIGWSQPWRTPFFAVTDYGVAYWILIPTLALFIVAVLAGSVLTGLNRLASYEISMLAGYTFAGVGVPSLASNLMKRLVGRGRPDVFDQVGAFHFQNIVNDWAFQSFPSGHSTASISLAFVIGFLVPRLFGWLLAIGILVCISRVPVGMHYPSDVFGGACVGLIGAYAVRYILAGQGWMFKRRGQCCIVPRRLCAIRRLYRRASA